MACWRLTPCTILYFFITSEHIRLTRICIEEFLSRSVQVRNFSKIYFCVVWNVVVKIFLKICHENFSILNSENNYGYLRENCLLLWWNFAEYLLDLNMFQTEFLAINFRHFTVNMFSKNSLHLENNVKTILDPQCDTNDNII